MIGHKFKILTETQFQKIKQTNPDYLLDYGVISFAKYIQQNIIGKKISIPILRFYNITFPDKYQKKFKLLFYIITQSKIAWVFIFYISDDMNVLSRIFLSRIFLSRIFLSRIFYVMIF